MCKYNDIILDMCCDHGYIAISLLRKNKCKKCYAVDINKLPLNKAKTNIKNNNLENYIECVESNGFEFIKNKEDANDLAAVIAGVGGDTITSILGNKPNVIKNMNYILIQPNSCSRNIRRHVYSMSIHVEQEDIVFSNGAYYEYILIFPKQQGILSEEYQNFLLEFEYEIPVCVIDNTGGIYNDFINWKIMRYEKALFQMINSDFMGYKISKFKKKISMLRRYIK